MVLGGEEGKVCKVLVDGTRLEHVLEFKYLSLCWMNQVQVVSNVGGKW